MDTWDGDDLSDIGVNPVTPSIKNKWAGEDVDEDVLDSWDQEPEKENPVVVAVAPATEKKTNAKGRRKKKVVEDLDDEEDLVELSMEEIMADKIRKQKLQEEGDLVLAKEIFGLSSTNLVMESKEDYDKVKDEVLKLVSNSVKNSNFFDFTEELIHSLCVHLPSSYLKKIHVWVNNLHIEKNKLEKGEKNKKKGNKGKAKLKLEGDNDYSVFTEEYDDFI